MRNDSMEEIATPYASNSPRRRAVVFHGSGSSPSSVTWLARIIGERGFAVDAPDSSGDVIQVAEEYAKKGFDLYAGHSRGGSIALIASALAGRGAVITVGTPADRLLQARWLSLHQPGSVQRTLYQDLERRLGNPWEDPIPYDRTSLIRYTRYVRGPVLIIHGDSDPIVRSYHADILEDFLRLSGAHVEKILVRGMGHAPRREHIEIIRRAIHSFLERHGL
ncbi:MAG: prolyl oligopeptidase family serine peptidase [Sulfolobales archaeon]